MYTSTKTTQWTNALMANFTFSHKSTKIISYCEKKITDSGTGTILLQDQKAYKGTLNGIKPLNYPLPKWKMKYGLLEFWVDALKSYST